MSFHSATHRHDGDRKNSTEESSGLLSSSHGVPDEVDLQQRQWPVMLVVIVVVETLILAILGFGIVYFLSKSSSQFPPNAVFCMAASFPICLVLEIDTSSTGATYDSLQKCRLLTQLQTVLD